MNEDRSDHDWLRVKRLGLEKPVRRRADYHRIVAENSLSVRETVVHFPLKNPTDAYILELHRRLFQGVHPWAGRFRIPTDPHTIVAGYPGADALRIGRELALLRRQFDEFLSSMIVPGMTYLALAFWHLRFERIHPFIDGNGRAGRFLLEAQLNAMKQPEFRRSLVSPEKFPYMEALKIGSRSHDLGPLARLIAEVNHDDRMIEEMPSPFRLAPFFDLTAESLEAELEKSRRE